MIYPSIKEIPSWLWVWSYFTPQEFACKGDGSIRVKPEFMDRLQRVRVKFNKPMIVTSGYRSPAYNAKVSGTGEGGPHTTGRAVDIAVRGEDAYRLLKLALEESLTGIGISQKGASRFIHLDDLAGEKRPRIWSY